MDDGAPNRMLLTGVSGVGKSSLVEALGGRGIEAVDTDTPFWRVPSELAIAPDPVVADGPVQPDWVWHEGRMAELLARPRATPLVVAGCVENQGRFRDRFEHVVVLTAPADVIVQRLTTRTTNPSGRTPEEQARILGELAEVEPLLRRSATRVIDTSAPFDEVLATVLRNLRPDDAR